jgi:hypothetical protein
MPATTTPTAQKAAAKKAAGHDKGKAKAATTKVPQSKEVTAEQKKAAKAKAVADAKRVAKWTDSKGVELVKGTKVLYDGKPIGTVAYRHTHHDDNDKPVGMIGVALTGKGDALVIGGRTVKNRSLQGQRVDSRLRVNIAHAVIGIVAGGWFVKHAASHKRKLRPPRRSG